MFRSKKILNIYLFFHFQISARKHLNSKTILKKFKSHYVKLHTQFIFSNQLISIHLYKFFHQFEYFISPCHLRHVNLLVLSSTLFLCVFIAFQQFIWLKKDDRNKLTFYVLMNSRIEHTHTDWLNEWDYIVLVSRYFDLIIYYFSQFAAAHNPTDPMDHCSSWAIKIEPMLIFFSFIRFYFSSLLRWISSIQ